MDERLAPVMEDGDGDDVSDPRPLVAWRKQPPAKYGATGTQSRPGSRKASRLSRPASAVSFTSKMADQEDIRNSVISLLTYDMFEKPADTAVDEVPAGLSWCRSGLILLNVLVAAGIVEFPFLIHRSGGFLPAIVAQIILVALCFVSTTCLVWCAHLWRAYLYQDIMLVVFGRFGQYVCSVVVIVMIYCLTTSFLIAIGDQLKFGVSVLAPDFAASGSIFASKTFLLICVSFIFIQPLLFAKRIEKLQFASVVANLSVLILIAAVLYEYFVRLKSSEPVKINNRVDFLQVFLSMPAYALNYTFNLTAVAVYGRMKRQTVGTFMKAGALSLAVSFCFYNVLGYAAYMTFGSAVKENFLTNYDAKGNWIIALAGFTFTLKLCFTYPIEYFVTWTAICTLIDGVGWTKLIDYENHHRTAKSARFLFAVGFLCLTLLVACVAPDIAVVLDVVSAICLNIQFTIPGFCILATLNRTIYNPLAPVTRTFMLVAAHLFILTGIVLSVALFFARLT